MQDQNQAEQTNTGISSMAKAKKMKAHHRYDKEADDLYISFGDDEPTYVENIDDMTMLEIGWFSGLPKGLRLNHLSAICCG